MSLHSLAIVDDLLAVLVIALFYTASLNIGMLLLAAAITAVLFIGNRLRVNSLWFYGLLGVALWVAVLFSGIHATIAGVVLAMCVPATSRIDRVSFFQRSRELVTRITQRANTSEDEGEQLDAIHELEEMCEHAQSPLHRIEHGLGSVVSFLIMPIFALVNAGIVIDTSLVSSLSSSLGLGVILGLFIGKQIGISLAVIVSVKLGIASMPRGVRPIHMYGVALLCGIGFTMALFVANLAFIDPAHLDVAKLSIIVGSTLSAVAGAVVLRSTT